MPCWTGAAMTRMDTSAYRFRGRRRDPGARPVAGGLTQAVLAGSTDSTLGSSPMWRYTPRKRSTRRGKSRPPSAVRPGGTPARRSLALKDLYDNGGSRRLRFGGPGPGTSRRRTRRHRPCLRAAGAVWSARRSPTSFAAGVIPRRLGIVEPRPIPGGSSAVPRRRWRPGCVGRDGQRHRGSIRIPAGLTGLSGEADVRAGQQAGRRAAVLVARPHRSNDPDVRDAALVFQSITGFDPPTRTRSTSR